MSVINTHRPTLISPHTAETLSRSSSRAGDSSKTAEAAPKANLASLTQTISAENVSAALPGIDDAAGALAATQLAKSLLYSNFSGAVSGQSRLSPQNVLNLLQD